MADLEPLHDGRGLRPDRQGGDRPHSRHNHESRLIMTSGHLGNYVSLRWRPSDEILTPVISPTLWPTISSDPRLKSFLPRMARAGGTGAKVTRFGLWKRAFGDTGKCRRRPGGMVCRALC